MTPIRSNINKETCSPVSSNCVIWQGPDLPCLALCTGQTISEVVYEVGAELCKIKDNLNLTDLDLKCLIDKCLACPEPAKTLDIVLQLLIDKVCELEDIINTLDPSVTTTDPLVRMAACFQYVDADGDFIKDLPHTQYTKKIGSKVCDILNDILGLQADINTLQSEINDLDVRVTALENETLPQVTLTCVNPGVQDMDVAIEAIEADYCTLKSALGSAGDLLDVIDGECTAPVKKLTDPTTDLWTGTSTTIAGTLEKMWLAICDLRSAVATIQNTCCAFSCDDLLIDFDVKVVDEQTILLFFGAKSVVPANFTDCNATLGNKLNFTDGNGNQWFTYIKLRDDVFNDPTVLSNGYEIDLSVSPIDVTTGMTLGMDACMTDGTTTCVKCVDVSVLPALPDCCLITASGTVTIYYKVCSITQ